MSGKGQGKYYIHVCISVCDMKYFTVLIKCMDVSIVFRKAGEKEPVTQLVGKPS